MTFLTNPLVELEGVSIKLENERKLPLEGFKKELRVLKEKSLDKLKLILSPSEFFMLLFTEDKLDTLYSLRE